MPGHPVGQAGRQRGDLTVQSAQPGEALTGEVDLDPAQRSEQAADRALMAGAGQVGSCRAIARQERPQIGVESVADPGLLGHEVLAGLDQELELEARIDQPDRRQVWFSEGHPGDGQGVARGRSCQPVECGSARAG